VTVAVLVLLRQVTLLSLRTGLVSPSKQRNALVLGEPVPDALLEAAPALRDESHVSYVVWLTSTCSACSELADQLRKGAIPNPIVAMVTGTDLRARELTSRLETVATVVAEPAAASIVAELGLDASPFAVEVERGRITGWTALRGIDELEQLRTARESSDASEWATSGEPSTEEGEEVPQPL
jgi:hypothetical protein